MGGLLALIAGSAFLSILAYDKNGAVPFPKTKWNDDVGQSVSDSVNKSISSYNKSIKNCQDVLSNVKTQAENVVLKMNFQSEMKNLEWQAKQIDKYDVNATVEYINKILAE